jgi:hypothetical protein
MQDIVPAPAAMKTIAQVSLQNDRAVWGHIFGDQEVGALVAVQMHEGKPDQSPEDSDLCLLLWKQGWRFVQAVGKVTTQGETAENDEFNGEIKQRVSTHSLYVINRLGLYPAGEHTSWLCDSKPHRLIPTGWPSDALPSIAGNTITFKREDKPGYSPEIISIHSFDGTVGPLLAKITGEDVNHRDRGQFITVPTPDHHGWETWRIWDRSPEYHFQRTVYGLARMKGDNVKGTPEGEATAEFSRTYGSGGSYITTLFLEWRLTGLSKEALEGTWGEDARHDFPKPEWVKITGDAEAVQRFSWPALPDAAKAGQSATPVPQPEH